MPSRDLNRIRCVESGLTSAEDALDEQDHELTETVVEESEPSTNFRKAGKDKDLRIFMVHGDILVVSGGDFEVSLFIVEFKSD